MFLDCGPVIKPANGEVKLTGTLEGSVATYSCHPTFKQTGGSTERTCQGGAWTGEPLTCDPVGKLQTCLNKYIN